MPVLTPLLLAVLTTGPGIQFKPGHVAESADMVTAYSSGELPNPTHLGHWMTPRPGRPQSLSVNATTGGAGLGSVTYGILVEEQGTTCQLTVPCSLAPGDPIQRVECTGGVFQEGAEVHLEYSHTCTEAPHTGTVVAGFTYQN